MHIYKNEIGDWLPSVTEIIQMTRPKDSIEKLQNAIEAKKKREGMNDQDWEKYMKKAQDRGTKTHLYMETYLPLVEVGNKEFLSSGKCSESTLKSITDCRNEFESDPMAGDYCRAITDFVRNLNKKTREWTVITTEAEVVNEELQYGGRTDSVIKMDGEIMLLDLKTNGGYWSNWKNCQVYKWEKWIKGFNGTIIETETGGYWDMVDEKLKDKFVQLGLYIMAMRDMWQRGKFDYQITKTSILVAFPGEYQYIPMESQLWAGCLEESERRVKEYMEVHLDEWKKRAVAFSIDHDT